MENEPMNEPGFASEQDERTWAMFAHLGGLLGFVVPFGNLIPSLIIWQINKGKSDLVEENAREALNFQILVSLAGVGATILSFVLIGIPLLVAIGIINLCFSIIGGIKANQGEYYQYPFRYQIIKE